MAGFAGFKTPDFVPPGGLFYYETHGEKVVGRTLSEMAPMVRALMEKYGVPGTPEREVAAYMCARMPDPGRHCRGASEDKGHVRPAEAWRNSLPYCAMPPAAPETAKARIEACARCPRHERKWCPTCAGHAGAADREFARHGTRRPRTGLDARSGVCACAKAYELAIASVEYGEGEPVWDGAPETCWRYQRVVPDRAASNADASPTVHVESQTTA